MNHSKKTHSGNKYRDRIARYIERHFGPSGISVYTELELGKTIIGKNRKIDIFLVRKSDGEVLGIECKYQSTGGTTDEKIPYALEDLRSMWIPGVLVYAGEGWSDGIRHTLAGSREAVRCDPGVDCLRSSDTTELDHVIAAVFKLWSMVINERRQFRFQEQIELPGSRPKSLPRDAQSDFRLRSQTKLPIKKKS